MEILNMTSGPFLKAKKGIRTLNNNLGKVELYQLSYFRIFFIIFYNDNILILYIEISP
jgi:hypothetical protein